MVPIPIYDYGEIDGRLFVSMRLIGGRDLHEVLADGPLDPARSVRIVDQVAKALHAAHRVGLLHRDVKPSNILLDENDFAYLIDFGIARAADETRMTKSGYAIGTFAYIAPERLGARAEEDARADIYSLACVLYECLTGSPPFDADTLAGLVAAHLHTPPPQPSAAKPNLPTQIDEVIAKGMAKDPDRRYQTALELAASAQSAVTEPAATTQFDVVDVEKERRPKNPPKSRANRLGIGKGSAGMAILIAALLVAVLVGVIATLHIQHEPPRPTPQMTSHAPEATSKPAASAPPPPVVPASAVDSILLSTAKVNQIVGTSHMRLKDSTYGMSENAGGLGVTPAECAGVVHGADRTVWADTGFEAMRDQTYIPEYAAGNPTAPA